MDNTAQQNTKEEGSESDRKVCITEKISAFVKNRAINLSAMSRATGIPYGVLYDSLANKKRARPLSVDEAANICKILGMKVDDFADDAEQSARTE